MKNMKVDIELQNPCEFITTPDLSACQKWVETALKIIEYKQPCSVVIRFVDEEEGRALNRDFRNKNTATNVLSFPYEISALEGSIPELSNPENHLGDLVLCEKVIVQEAQQQHKLLTEHWAHLIIHGILHLQGYDHLDENEADKMEALEINILKTLGYKNPYETNVK